MYQRQSDTTKSEPVALALSSLWTDQPLLTNEKGATNCALLLIKRGNVTTETKIKYVLLKDHSM